MNFFFVFSCFSRALWATFFSLLTSLVCMLGHPLIQFRAKVESILLSCRQSWVVKVVHLLHTNLKVFLPPLLQSVDVKDPQVHLTRPGGMREAIRRPQGRRAEHRAGSSKFCSPSLASTSVFRFFHIFQFWHVFFPLHNPPHGLRTPPGQAY